MKIKKELIIHPKYPHKTIKGKAVYRKQEDGTYKWQWKNIYRKELKINENE